MDANRFNMEIRKFLKLVGVISQREIEEAAQKALAVGKLQHHKTLAAKMVLTIPAIGLSHEVEGTLELD